MSDNQNKYQYIHNPIVVVDDEPDIRETVIFLLEEEIGYHNIIQAENPVEALELLEGQTPLLIISDYKMPKMNGIDFATTVKGMFPETRFILATGYADKEVAIEAVNQSVNYLLEKPFNMEIVEKLILEALDAKYFEIKQELEEMEELTDGFVEEAEDLLADLPNLILQIEKKGCDPVIVDLIFRKLHTLKGGAGAISLAKDLSELAHEFENVLGKMRDRVFGPSEEHIDLFLKTTDQLVALVEALKKREELDEEKIKRVDAFKGAMRDILDGIASGKFPAVSEVFQEAPAEELVEEPMEEDKGVMVANEKLDTFMKLSGELIVLKNSLRQICLELDLGDGQAKQMAKLSNTSQALNKITDNLQEQIMDVRKVKVGSAFNKLPRMVRTTAKKLKKKIKLEITGNDLSVDKNVNKVLGGCMTHLVRNAVDHGVESQEDRTATGKNPQGSIWIRAYQMSEKIFIEIEDDGKGIDRNIIANKAVSKGLISEEKAAAMEDHEVFDLIFLPGFSTAEVITDVSGRGVGMDVVKSDIISLNGKVKIESEVGKGSKIVIEIPVPKTVMVEKSIIAQSGSVYMAFPQVNVAQVLSGDMISKIDFSGAYGFQFKEKTIPLVNIQEFYEQGSSQLQSFDLDKCSIVVTFYKNHFVGIIVDRIKEQLEAVIRPFSDVIGQIDGFQGTSLIGDAGVAYVIDPQSVVERIYNQTKAA
ncbi:MAG: hypothetical protein CL677_04375 [Bdellovibrionaceae bacterium]|nr:hypothetical protein [Pseudobdellovibrionaceae bacterium]|tara:strand:+ start:34561 stop:36672 length:2112 start_codon:yes stop_codon:yes gene_type:complete